MKVRDVNRLIEDDGWYFERQRGSHRIYRHAEKPGTVTIAGQPGQTYRGEPSAISSVKPD